MKNIAVLVHNVVNDYNVAVVEGIISYYEKIKDTRLIIATVHTPHSTSSDFDYQYWSSIEILKSKEIDGIISVTNSFLNFTSLEAYSKELEVFTGKPVVSVSTPLEIKGSKYTCTVSDEAIYQMVKHFKEKHGRKNFAFLSASLNAAPEAKERLIAFKKALKDNDLEFNPKRVIPGDFTPGTAKTEMLKLYKTKEDIDFDAIICVNDFTAGGCLLAFQELGVNCPEEVSVSGFDNSPFALLTYPTLTSVDQNIPGNGRKVAEIMYKILNGEKIEKKTVLQCSPIYRQSCGCVDWKIHSNAFYDANNVYHEIDEGIKIREQNVLIHSMETIENLYNLLNLMDTQVGMRKVATTIKNSMGVAKLPSIVACFYNRPVTVYPTDKIVLPEKAKVLLQINLEKGIEKYYTDETCIEINPLEKIIPAECDTNVPGIYFLLPLFLRENNYGYMVCRNEHKNLSMTSVHLKILMNIIINAYEYTKNESNRSLLIQRAQDLNLQSKTDELTKVFNRRGFIDYGQRLLDLSVSMGKLGCIFFCDLDGLKTINDTYGHKIGDLAIQTEAKVLKAAFRDSDLVGRLSGDEFGVVAPGFPIYKVDYLRERLIQLNKELSEEAGLPFTLSISIGPIEYTEEEKDLLKLLTQADKNLYEEKKIKHAKK